MGSMLSGEDPTENKMLITLPSYSVLHSVSEAFLNFKYIVVAGDFFALRLVRNISQFYILIVIAKRAACSTGRMTPISVENSIIICMETPYLCDLGAACGHAEQHSSRSGRGSRPHQTSAAGSQQSVVGASR